MLPFIEQQALYNQFDLSQPWDSPRNKALLSKMPPVYMDKRYQSLQDQTGLTYYRGFVGPNTVLGDPQGVNLRVLENAAGPANTLVVVVAGEPVPWTKPEDPSFNEFSPLGGPRQGDSLGLYADGHVAPIPAGTSRARIGSLTRWNRSETVMPPR